MKFIPIKIKYNLNAINAYKTFQVFSFSISWMTNTRKRLIYSFISEKGPLLLLTAQVNP